MKESEQIVRLRVTMAFNRYRVGDIIERTAAEAQRMLQLSWYGQKMVELADPPQPSPEPVPELTAAPRKRRERATS